MAAALDVMGFDPTNIENWCENHAKYLKVEWNRDVIKNLVPQIILGEFFDRRYSSTRLMTKILYEMRPDAVSSPTTPVAVTPKVIRASLQPLPQGQTDLLKEMKDLYHKNQDQLLIFEKYFEGYSTSDGGKWQQNGTNLTTDQFCQSIDRCTKRLDDEAKKFEGMTNITPAIETLPKIAEEINKMFELVCYICSLRMLHRMSVTNHLADMNSWTQWVNHNQVIVSFLVLCSMMMYHASRIGYQLDKPW